MVLPTTLLAPGHFRCVDYKANMKQNVTLITKVRKAMKHVVGTDRYSLVL